MSGDSNKEDIVTTEDIRRLIQRHVNCLADPSKIVRKRGLQDIKRETICRKLGGTILQDLANDVLKPVLKCFSDTSEVNRELSVNFVTEYFNIIPQPHATLAYILPCLVQRLGQEEILEPAEELRQLIVENLLMAIVELCGKKVAAFLDEMVHILKRTISDPFGEVKKSSCKVASSLARSIPEHFHMQSESLIAPLMLSITHQHSKVRVAVVEATADVIQYGNGKNVDDVISHLAQRLFDQSPAVRRAVIRIMGRWLLELPDRYSFFHKFIPLILTGFNDDMPDIQEEAKDLWHRVGLLYQQENENDLKDKMDFEAPVPVLYPRDTPRPCVGCRELVQRNLSKLMPGIYRDLGDWVVETRVKTSQLLHILLLHAEDYTTQHMQPLVQSLLRACGDEERGVLKNALRSAELIGAFVPPEIFCKLILQSVLAQAGTSPTALEVLASIISGCSGDVIGNHLSVIVDTLTDTDVCQVSEKSDYHYALLRCVNAIIIVCHDQLESVSLPLFTVVITVLAVSKSEEISRECDKNLELLANGLGLKDGATCLYHRHAKQVIDAMEGSFESWTKYSVERKIFDTLLSLSGPVVGDLLAEIMPVLKCNLNPDKDVELRLNFFTLLSKLLLNLDQTLNSSARFSREYVRSVVCDMVAPNLVWKAGRTAGAIRTIAMSSLWALVRSGAIDVDMGVELLTDPLLPLLSSLLDDDTQSTREITAKTLTRFFTMCQTRLTPDLVLHKIYMDLLKRMDDASDQIRMTVSSTWSAFFKCFGSDYDIKLNRAHLEEMYTGLLVHMDDPLTEMQVSTMNVLKAGGSIAPNLLIREIEKVKHKHRTDHYCNELLVYLQNLSK